MFPGLQGPSVTPTVKFLNLFRMALEDTERHEGYPGKSLIIWDKIQNCLQGGSPGVLSSNFAETDNPLDSPALAFSRKLIAYYYYGGPRINRMEEWGPWFELGQPLEHR